MKRHDPGSEKDGEIARTLTDCCARGTPAVVVAKELGVLCQARFAAIHATTVVFDLFPNSDHGLDLLPASLCSVAFNQGGRDNTFLTGIQGYSPGTPASPPRLVLRLPTALASVNARSAFRVLIFPSAELQLKVIDECNRTSTPRPVNLSMTGILVEYSATEDPDLPLNAPITVELRLSNDSATLRAEVRRREKQGRYGLVFPELLRDADIEPPEVLRSIVRSLERHWLRHRLQ